MSVILLVMLGAIGVTAVARRWLPQPGLAVLVLAAAVSFIPGVPHLEVPAHLIFALVMPPLLYSAAVRFSFFVFIRNLQVILGLGVVLVVVTCSAVVAISWWIAPTLGLTGALLLGAVVSPPDTVTMVTHGKQLGLPRRVVAVLTGESLVNDAAALTILAIALSRLTGQRTLIANPVGFFVYGALVGVLLGFLLGNLTHFIRRRLADHDLEAVLGLMLCFTAYFVAEQLSASGVLAVVMAGFTMATHSNFLDHGGYSQSGWATRIQERNLWPVIDQLLEAFVFAYMGLQLRYVVDELVAAPASGRLVMGLGLTVLLAVMVVRIIWVGAAFSWTNLVIRWTKRKIERWRVELARDPERRARLVALARQRRMMRRQQLERRQQRLRSRSGRQATDWSMPDRLDLPSEQLASDLSPAPDLDARGLSRRRLPTPTTFAEIALVAWTGMRGIVTLAASEEVPVFATTGGLDGQLVVRGVAFIVAIGTLLIQGLTLPWLGRRLAIDTTAEDQAERQAVERLQTILDSLPADDFSSRRRAVIRLAISGQADEETGARFLASIDHAEAAAQPVLAAE